MSLSVLSDPAFHEFLLAIDQQLAADVKAAGCLQCGGRLDSASFPRRPRGALTDLGEAHRRRLSWCRAVEGCRRRATPPSVRFLGRRVYLSAVVTLASAMDQGLSEFRLATLRKLIGVSAATLQRWRRWWHDEFQATNFWRGAKGAFATPVEPGRLPSSLLERFRGDEPGRLVALLRFLSPLSRSPPRPGVAW